MNLFINRLWEAPFFFFTVVISVGFSVCVHEFCHAYTALKCGDPTAARAGHLTLNPLKQMGVLSLIMLLILGFCWGAVPINPLYLSRKQRIAISLAGPGANLALFIVGMIISIVLLRMPEPGVLATMLLIFAEFNLVLCVFNLLPIPGLDGGAVLAELLPMQKVYASELGKGIMIGMILLLFCFSEYLFVGAEYVILKIAGWLV